MTNLPLPLDVQNLKAFQLQGALLPDPLARGFTAWTPLGLCPQTLVIDSRYALAIVDLTLHYAPRPLPVFALHILVLVSVCNCENLTSCESQSKQQRL